MDNISIDIISEILEYCSLKDIGKLVQISKKFSKLDQYNYLWELKIDKLGISVNLMKNWSLMKLYYYLLNAEKISVHYGNNIFKTYIFKRDIEYAIEHIKSVITEEEYSIILCGLKKRKIYNSMSEMEVYLNSVIIYKSNKNNIIYKTDKGEIDNIVVYKRLVPTIEKFKNSLVKEKGRQKQKCGSKFLVNDLYHTQICEYISNALDNNLTPIYGYIDISRRLYIIKRIWYENKLKSNFGYTYSNTELIEILNKFGIKAKGRTKPELCEEIREVMKNNGHLLTIK